MTMYSLRDVPIKRKLTLISVVTSGIVLLLACSAFLTYEQVAFRGMMMRDLSISARMIGLNSAAALSFDDPQSAEQTLSALDAHPHVIAARVYKPSGEIFASYQRDPEAAMEWPEPMKDGRRLTARHLDLFRDIKFSNESIGTIYIRSDLQQMHERLVRYAAIAAMVFLLSSLLAFLIASRLQRVISVPILQLADTAAHVGVERNYSLRAVKQGDDEIGRLIDRFNEMLERIEDQDGDLRNAHDELEQRVEERTAALQLAQEVAEREKARFQFIFESVPVGISWRIPFEQGTHLVNPAHERITGVSAEDSVKASAFDRVTHPDDLETQRVLIDRFVRGEIDHYSMEKRYVHPNGRVVWAVITSRMFSDPAGGAQQSVTTLVEITDLKRAQEAAIREHARFKFIFESVPVGISLVVPGNRSTLLSNPAHKRITGVSSIRALKPDAFERATHPEDHEQLLKLTGKLAKGLIDQFSLEVRYLHPDGKIVWTVLTRRMFLDPATLTGQTVTTLVDITDRKRSSEELDRIFTLSEDMICTVGFDGYFRRINPAFERTLGYPDEELMAQPFIHYVEPADRESTEREQQSLAAHGSTTAFENRYRCKDGSIKWLQWKAVSVRAEELFYCVVRDVTKQREDALELEQIHQQLIDTSRQAGMAEVATGVLHNVGNVLNSVNVSATMVADRMRDSKIENVKKVSALLREHAGDLAAFIDEDARGKQIPGYLEILGDLLAAEQAEVLDELDQLGKNLEHIKDIVAMQQSYAKISGVAESVFAVDLVEDALRMNAGALARHDVTVVRDFQARPTLTVEKHKVLQILVNLIRNAKYACDELGRADKVITARITGDEERVEIAIIDNGVGIPPENLTRIFHHGFTTRKEGHGFGLHSGALAAAEIGGSLRADSQGAGKGATFVLALPIHPEGGDA